MQTFRRGGGVFVAGSFARENVYDFLGYEKQNAYLRFA